MQTDLSVNKMVGRMLERVEILHILSEEGERGILSQTGLSVYEV